MNQHDQMRQALRREFPLLDEIGLDQELHHCEWSIQQERKRLHQLLDELQTEQALSHVNETPKNEHDSNDVLNKSGNVDMMREALQECLEVFEAIPAIVPTHIELITQAIETRQKVQQALAAEPVPLVRLTDDRIREIDEQTQGGLIEFAHAIMDAMEEINK